MLNITPSPLRLREFDDAEHCRMDKQIRVQAVTLLCALFFWTMHSPLAVACLGLSLLLSIQTFRQAPNEALRSLKSEGPSRPSAAVHAQLLVLTLIPSLWYGYAFNLFQDAQVVPFFLNEAITSLRSLDALLIVGVSLAVTLFSSMLHYVQMTRRVFMMILGWAASSIAMDNSWMLGAMTILSLEAMWVYHSRWQIIIDLNPTPSMRRI